MFPAQNLLICHSIPSSLLGFPQSKWNSCAPLMELVLYRVMLLRIPESFGHCLTSPRTLAICFCNISGSIPKPRWNLTNIETLALGYNHLEGPIPNFFILCKIRLIYLENNNFDGIFNRSWTRFEDLEFSSNSIIGSIPSNVSGIQNLQSLILSSNHLNGTIPSWILSLTSLTNLDLCDNHFKLKDSRVQV